jgi:hypothetical protein
VTYVNTATRKLLADSASVTYVVAGSASASVINAAVVTSTTTLAGNLATPAKGSGQPSYSGAMPQAAQTTDSSPTMAPTMSPSMVPATAQSSAASVQSSLLLTASIVAIALFL